MFYHVVGLGVYQCEAVFASAAQAWRSWCTVSKKLSPTGRQGNLVVWAPHRVIVGSTVAHNFFGDVNCPHDLSSFTP